MNYDVYYNSGSNKWTSQLDLPAEAVIDLIYNALKSGYRLREGFGRDIDIVVTPMGNRSDDRVWVIRPSKG